MILDELFNECAGIITAQNTTKDVNKSSIADNLTAFRLNKSGEEAYTPEEARTYNRKKEMKSSEFAYKNNRLVESLPDSDTPQDPMVQVDDLESSVDDPVIDATISAVRELIGQGHTDVDPSVITNMVVAATGQPFLLKDLVAINNQSAEVRHYIDSINPSKVKFSSDILTVKNDNNEQQSQDETSKTIATMAARAGAKRN